MSCTTVLTVRSLKKKKKTCTETSVGNEKAYKFKRSLSLYDNIMINVKHMRKIDGS